MNCNFFSSQKEDEIEEYLKNKYASVASRAMRHGDGGGEVDEEISQQLLLPSVKDPNLWLVKCKVGEEESTLLLLMRKYLTFEHTGIFY